MTTVGLIAKATVAAVATAAGVTEAFTKAPGYAELTAEEFTDSEFSPLPEIVEDPVTEEKVAEPVKPKRRKKAEVTNESDSDG